VKKCDGGYELHYIMQLGNKQTANCDQCSVIWLTGKQITELVTFPGALVSLLQFYGSQI